MVAGWAESGARVPAEQIPASRFRTGQCLVKMSTAISTKRSVR